MTSKFFKKTFVLAMALSLLLTSSYSSKKVSAAKIVPGIPLPIGDHTKNSNVNATFNLDKGVVNIYGSGDMGKNVNLPTLRWFSSFEKDIKKVTIEKGVTSIGDFAFGGNGSEQTDKVLPNLKKVKISNTVRKIGEGAFYGAKSLREIDIPESVEEIGPHAFNSAISLEKVILHEGLKKIGTSAFMGCTSLTSIIIPEGITEIEGDTFHKSLNQITLPKSIHEIKKNAFKAPINAIIYSKNVTIEKEAFPDGSIITCYKNSFTEKSALEKGNITIRYIKEKTSVIKSPVPKIKVMRNKMLITCSAISNAVGYQIRFSKNKDMKNSTVVNQKKYVSKKFKTGTTFYVQARAYDKIIGDKINGKWSKKVKVVIK